MIHRFGSSPGVDWSSTVVVIPVADAIALIAFAIALSVTRMIRRYA